MNITSLSILLIVAVTLVIYTTYDAHAQITFRGVTNGSLTAPPTSYTIPTYLSVYTCMDTEHNTAIPGYYGCSFIDVQGVKLFHDIHWYQDFLPTRCDDLRYEPEIIMGVDVGLQPVCYDTVDIFPSWLTCTGGSLIGHSRDDNNAYYRCEDSNGNQAVYTMKTMWHLPDNIQDLINNVENQGIQDPNHFLHYAHITHVWNASEWIPFNFDTLTLHTDTPKFRGWSQNFDSITLTLNGTQVGGNNVRHDGVFQKAWKHDPLTESGTYILEVIHRNDKTVISIPFTIIVPNDNTPVTVPETIVTLECRPGLDCVPEYSQQQEQPPPSNSTQQEDTPPAPPTNSTQQESPPETPPQQEEEQQEEEQQQSPPPTNSTVPEQPTQPETPTNSTQSEPEQPEPEQPETPPAPPEPVKSAAITLIHDGTGWVTFSNGITIHTGLPKFQGTTDNLSSVHITLHDKQVGGTNISDTGTFWKSWKHEPLGNGVYTIEVRESSNSDVLYTGTITIALQ